MTFWEAVRRENERYVYSRLGDILEGKASHGEVLLDAVEHVAEYALRLWEVRGEREETTQ